MGLVLDIINASATIFREAAPYILLGFFVAGVIRAYLTPATVSRYLRGDGFRSVFYASLLGVPIPL
ncbi:MAG: permease [Desulfomonile sp.]|nr:permease [Desulfomonile sp.]